MDVMELKERRMKLKSKASVSTSSSLSSVGGLPMSSASNDVSAIQGNGCSVSVENHTVINENRVKDMPSWNRTYQRKKMISYQNVACVDGLYLLAVAADEVFQSMNTHLIDDDRDENGGDLVESHENGGNVGGNDNVAGMHRNLNSELFEKLKEYAERVGSCKIGQGWTARHKVCNHSGTHFYYHSPSGFKFSSMSAVVDHEKKMKDGEVMLEPGKGRIAFRGSPVCPHDEIV